MEIPVETVDNSVENVGNSVENVDNSGDFFVGFGLIFGNYVTQTSDLRFFERKCRTVTSP
ncbi:MAG: hypothetical protein IIY70_02345 [Oscillospiraceae bacterium]|nr:hypothetical protein [Oscillospiraceae bacterium]